MNSTRRGFSLIELIVVIAILAAFLSLSVVGYSAVTQASALTAGAALLNDQLGEARQDAVAQNTTVEVRIYYLPSPSGAASVYRAMQLHWLKADGTTPAINKAVYLPASVVIDATAVHSPLIASNSQTATPDATDPNLTSQTRVFHFLPDGSTDLNPATNWFLTLRAANQSNAAHFPSNWASVRVDPTTGRVQVYRP